MTGRNGYTPPPKAVEKARLDDAELQAAIDQLPDADEQFLAVRLSGGRWEKATPQQALTAAAAGATVGLVLIAHGDRDRRWIAAEDHRGILAARAAGGTP